MSTPFVLASGCCKTRRNIGPQKRLRVAVVVAE
jgi:hypothetical protein